MPRKHQGPHLRPLALHDNKTLMEAALRCRVAEPVQFVPLPTEILVCE